MRLVSCSNRTSQIKTIIKPLFHLEHISPPFSPSVFQHHPLSPQFDLHFDSHRENITSSKLCSLSLNVTTRPQCHPKFHFTLTVIPPLPLFHPDLIFSVIDLKSRSILVQHRHVMKCKMNRQNSIYQH